MLSLFNSFKKGLMILMILFPIMTVAPTSSYAADVDDNGITKSLCSIVNLVKGKAGKAIATISVIFLAFGLFVGKVTWGVAVATGVGIGALFGAETIVTLLIGGGSGGPIC